MTLRQKEYKTGIDNLLASTIKLNYCILLSLANETNFIGHDATTRLQWRPGINLL